jgi:hypothetical protein
MAETQKMAAADYRVDEAQLALLDAADARGEVTITDMMDAQRDNQQCLRDAGFTTGTVIADDTWYPPFPRIEYITGPATMDTNQQSAIIESCDAETVKYISRVYSFQPQAKESYWLAADEKASSIAQCLRDHDIPEDLIGESTEEIVMAAVRLYNQYGDFEIYPATDCMQGLALPTTNR